jgi:uncharacterized cysteine cluster protein YcgN (CxxCxxCC family)
VIFHIAAAADVAEAIDNDLYFCDSLENEGFIHCSTREQIVPVANRYYTGHLDLVLLLIDEKEISAPIKYESPLYPSAEIYPHVYGPIQMKAVKQIIELQPQKDGSFEFPKDKVTHRWWLEKTLDQFSTKEWESLCDGCARCCLYKLEDIDTQEIFYTDVACRFLNLTECTCTDYPNRHINMPTCIILTPEKINEINWMPETCAYRLLSEGKDIAWWHPLVTGKKDSTQKAGKTIDQFAVLENKENISCLEDHVQEWLH